MQFKELSPLLSPAIHLTSAQRPTVIQVKDASAHLSYVINHVEEQPANVTHPLEFVRSSNHLVMTMIHVPMIPMLMDKDVPTFKNVSQTTCVSFQNATRQLEHAHTTNKAAMMVMHVLMTHVIHALENVSTLSRLATAHLETLEHVTPPPDNVNTTQLAELTLIVKPEHVILQKDAFLHNL